MKLPQPLCLRLRVNYILNKQVLDRYPNWGMRRRLLLASWEVAIPADFVPGATF